MGETACGRGLGTLARPRPRPLAHLTGETGPPALAVAACGAAALALLALLIRREPVPRGDDAIYERMAQHPFATHTFPFGFRFGLPLLVHVLPFAHTTSFLLLAILAAGVAAAFAYLLMRELGARGPIAAALAILMCVSPPFLIVALRNGRNTDIASVAILMAATYFALRRDHRRLAVTLLLGVTVREATLFAVPLAYALWAARPLDMRAARGVLALAAPAIAAYAAIRLGLHTVGKAQVPGYGGSLAGERLKVVELGLRTPFREARRMLTAYGPLWLAAPLALRDMSFARRGLVLVAQCVLAMTFALDWGRMILLAAPVFYPASAHVLGRHRRALTPALAAFAALALGYAVYMDRTGVRTGIIENPAPSYPVR
jgi:hypothetical protein